MIFVAVGTQKFQMDRLLEALDNLKNNGVIQEEIFAQKGCSTYTPSTYDAVDFLNREQFQEMIEKSKIVITHSGVGTIIKALNAGKKVVVVPRLSKYGEHVDDHQIQIANAFSSRNYVFMCMNLEKLSEVLHEIKDHTFDKYHSGNEKAIAVINKFLDSIKH